MAVITKLAMQGFKSFNRRVAIPFLAGVNAIAGPNGSGKSNVLDAIAFVLGRTSAKSMRADRLHELIFHGGTGKNPADLASVTLTFDNSKKEFPVDSDELSINRKVNRKGAVVYKINERTVTRDKIIQTLAPARIQPDGHNIILQGDVTEIIEMSPVERRGIIDEISGIAEYNDKREKAQKDLDAVDQKLKEAEIIISQRYSIFKKMEDERNAAIKYQNLQQQSKVLKASVANKKVQTFQEEIAKFDEKLAEKKELSGKVNAELEKVEEDLGAKESGIREVASKIIDLSKRFQIEKEISDLRSELIVKRSKIDSNTREIERLNSLIEKLQALESRKAELVGELPRSVQSILRLNLRGVHGTVASLVSVPEKYQIAVEVAAGPHFNDIIVSDEDVAAYCIEYLRRERIGRATFLPLTKIKPNLFRENELLHKHGVVGVASKLIKYDTRYMTAVEFVFGNTLIIENLDAGRAIGVGRARMVTLDGDLLERSGAMIGGHYIRSHAKSIEASTSRDIDSYIDLRKRLREEAGKLQDQVEELESRLKKMAVSEQTKQFIDLEKVRIASEQDVDKLRDRRKSLNERKLNLEIELNRISIERARMETDLQNAKAELQQYGQIAFVDEKLAKLEDMLMKTDKELATLGPVNFKAIEEFEKLKTEFEGYKQKYEKILGEKKAVLDMIAQIEERRKEVFYGTLNEIKKAFNNIFVKMLNGTSSLDLEDPNNIESGLLIKASPRAKTLINIDAMSGGEKSLTALAFLFAIQSHKPAPFYILDEIDAALDKANSKIVADMIKEFSKGAQFIIITHNDTTVKSADHLYGVSMIEGESKIVSVEMPKQ
ncbi:MAG: chromosome segregation protein SMC [Candidatus Aenigmarchaeota archaeon]|nr:chromosome segregation protein SMC [Candidatus Aenigmarchaeota archaeon]